MQNHSGARAPLTVAAGFDDVTFWDAELIPYATFTYWVDRVTFDRAEDDLRDQSILASLGYSF